MLDIFDIAHPVLTLTMVLVVLVMLWIIGTLNAKIRVLENRLDSVDGLIRDHDDALEMLTPSHTSHEAIPRESTAEALANLGPARD